MEKKKIHYAWIILVACCLLQAGGIGLLSNTSAAFISGVCQDRELSFVDEQFGAPILNGTFAVVDQNDFSDEAAYNTYIEQEYGSREAYLESLGEYGAAYSQAVASAAGVFTVYMMLQGLVSAVMMPFAGRILAKVNIRVIMSIGTVVLCGTFALMSKFTAMWQWYLAGAVMGVGSTVIFTLPAPVLIGNWFRKKTGTAMGIAMACANIGGAVALPLITRSIAANGWRTTYLVVGIVSVVLVLPCTLFLFRFKPADKGLQPYGFEENTAAAAAGTAARVLPGVTAKRAVKSLPFFLILLMAGLVGYNTTHTNVFTNFGASIRLSAERSAVITSCILIGGIFFKLFLGFLNDKIGVRKTAFVGFGLAAVAFGLLIGCVFFDALAGSVAVFVAALLLGTLSGMCGTTIPLTVRSVFGVREFSAIFSYVTAAIAVFGALGVTLISKFAAAGGYGLVFSIGIALTAVALVCTLVALKTGKKLQAEPAAAIPATNEATKERD